MISSRGFTNFVLHFEKNPEIYGLRNYVIFLLFPTYEFTTIMYKSVFNFPSLLPRFSVPPIFVINMDVFANLPTFVVGLSHTKRFYISYQLMNLVFMEMVSAKVLLLW